MERQIIDENHQESLIARLASRLIALPFDAGESGLSSTLDEIGNSSGADRTAVYCCSPGRVASNAIAEWSHSEAAAAAASLTLDSSLFPRLKNAVDRGEIVDVDSGQLFTIRFPDSAANVKGRCLGVTRVVPLSWPDVECSFLTIVYAEKPPPLSEATKDELRIASRKSPLGMKSVHWR